MSARPKLSPQEVIARLRAQEPCRIELEHSAVLDLNTGKADTAAAVSIRFYNENGRVSSRPDFTLVGSERGETFSSLLLLLSRVSDALGSVVSTEGA